MLTYLRLAEGTYEPYNFASIISSNISTTAEDKDITLVTNTELTVCPINTYYSADYSKCY